MPHKIPLTVAQKFVDSLLDSQPEALANLKDSEKFLGQVARSLTDFIELHSEDVGRIALMHDRAPERIIARGMEIATVIDVGASDGHWAAMLQKSFWPEAFYLCIEGYETWQERLEIRKRSLENFDYVLSAAGEKVGNIYFMKKPEHPTQGHAYDKKPDDRYEEVPQTTIDHEVATRRLRGPFMIKLDTHGREGEILCGAEQTLKDTNLLMIEVNNFADRGRMRFHELCAFVEERGFRCVDLAEPIWRKHDGVFWQCDMLFARSDRPEFSHRGF